MFHIAVLLVWLMATPAALAFVQIAAQEAPSCCCHGTCPEPQSDRPLSDCCQMSDGDAEWPQELPATATDRVQPSSSEIEDAPIELPNSPKEAARPASAELPQPETRPDRLALHQTYLN